MELPDRFEDKSRMAKVRDTLMLNGRDPFPHLTDLFLRNSAESKSVGRKKEHRFPVARNILDGIDHPWRRTFTKGNIEIFTCTPTAKGRI